MRRFKALVAVIKSVEIEADDEDVARDMVMERICDSDEFAEKPMEDVRVHMLWEKAQ